jgi:hypothetical protein
MLKRFVVACGLLLAATAAMADPWPWVQLDETPYLVGQGSHITYGVNHDDAGSIWGVFPVQATDSTKVAFFSPLSTDSLVPDIGAWNVPTAQVPSHHSLVYTSLTFQWDKALYVIGADTSAQQDPDGSLYWYNVQDESWHEYNIDEEEEGGYGLVLGPGCCIAYAPNLGYSSANQIDGWIYCLSGDNNAQGGMQFWRYSIEPSSYIAVGGIFPPNASLIPDQTPLFQWVPSSGSQYRLQVSTDDLFSNVVIDETLFSPEYQVTEELASGAYYWRIGTPNGGGWLWGTTHNFTLTGGFAKLTNITESVFEGAAMAYMASQAWPGDPSILVLPGSHQPSELSFLRWGIASEAWDDDMWQDHAESPKPSYPGTSLTTRDPVGGSGWYAAAAFGGSVEGIDCPWGYQPTLPPNDYKWWEYPDTAFDPLPKTLGPGATFVMGPAPYCYLTTGAPYYQDGEDWVTGDPSNHFYAIDPEHKKHKKDKGGSQAGDVLAQSRRAQVIASSNGVEVEYELPAAARVHASLHDAVGRQIGLLDVGDQQPGAHRLSWSHDRGGRRLASGAYFVLLEMGVEQATLKAVVR